MAKRILCCHGESHIMRAAEFKFERAGFEVECAFDEEDAWQRIQQRTPDLLITDCETPQLDGIELVRRVRADGLTHDLPAILLTANESELSKAELMAALGVVAILAQPFSPHELLRRVEQTLEMSTFRPRQLLVAAT